MLIKNVIDMEVFDIVPVLDAKRVIDGRWEQRRKVPASVRTQIGGCGDIENEGY